MTKAYDASLIEAYLAKGGKVHRVSSDKPRTMTNLQWHHAVRGNVISADEARARGKTWANDAETAWLERKALVAGQAETLDYARACNPLR